jgi:hypothetical protein
MGALAGATGLLLLPLSGLLLGAAAGLLGVALAGPVGGLLAGVGAEAALSSGVVGLGELAAAVLAVAPDDPHGQLPHDDWSVTRGRRWYLMGEVGARSVSDLGHEPAGFRSWHRPIQAKLPQTMKSVARGRE